MSYIVGNWKANHNLASALAFVTELKDLQQAQRQKNNYADQTNIAIIAPPALFLVPLAQKIAELNLHLGLAIQDLSSDDSGAHTGQIVATNLTELGVGYAIIGHSEARAESNQTTAQIAQKVAQALTHSLRPILCLDEPYLQSQADLIPDDQKSRCIVAFEPLSAIGTGQPFTPQNASLVIKKIKTIFGATVPVLYGGSVDPQNISSYLAISDGVLVGSASLRAESFNQLWQARAN